MRLRTAPAILISELAGAATLSSFRWPQACNWTGACKTEGCANKCVANLYPAYMAGFRASDAAYANDAFEAICPEIATMVYEASKGGVGEVKSLTRRLRMLTESNATATIAIATPTQSRRHLSQLNSEDSGLVRVRKCEPNSHAWFHVPCRRHERLRGTTFHFWP